MGLIQRSGGNGLGVCEEDGSYSLDRDKLRLLSSSRKEVSGSHLAELMDSLPGRATMGDIPDVEE